MPEPARLTDGDPEASLAKERVAEVVPLEAGLNKTLNVAVCPAAIVTGNVIPLIENSEPVELAAFTVTLDPLAVSDALSELLEPTVTLPKVKAVGLAAKLPTEIPDPKSAIGGTETSAERVTDPFETPVAWGLNTMENVAV
jgi:hypothetical protein